MTTSDVYGGASAAGTEAGPEPVAYTLWAVLRHDPAVTRAGADAASLASELDAATAQLPGDVTVRGFYDVSGLRADADAMVWLHGSHADEVQAGLRALRRTGLLAPLLPTWNAMGVHRPAEFTARHLPAFMRDVPPATWLTIYPFVRSYDWYLLPEDERRTMLRDHGLMGRDYPQVLANTVSSFALGDYEWLLGLEADELTDLVDLMRHLRYTEARRHVREEVPFFTGRRVASAELAEILVGSA